MMIGELTSSCSYLFSNKFYFSFPIYILIFSFEYNYIVKIKLFISSKF